MIAYEELCAALDQYNARLGGTPAAAPQADPAPMGFGAIDAEATSTQLDGGYPAAAQQAGYDEDLTQVGAPVSADASNEIDLRDVLSDEDPPV